MTSLLSRVRVLLKKIERLRLLARRDNRRSSSITSVLIEDSTSRISFSSRMIVYATKIKTVSSSAQFQIDLSSTVGAVPAPRRRQKLTRSPLHDDDAVPGPRLQFRPPTMSLNPTAQLTAEQFASFATSSTLKGRRKPPDVMWAEFAALHVVLPTLWLVLLLFFFFVWAVLLVGLKKFSYYRHGRPRTFLRLAKELGDKPLLTEIDELADYLLPLRLVRALWRLFVVLPYQRVMYSKTVYGVKFFVRQRLGRAGWSHFLTLGGHPRLFELLNIVQFGFSWVCVILFAYRTYSHDGEVTLLETYDVGGSSCRIADKWKSVFGVLGRYELVGGDAAMVQDVLIRRSARQRA